MTLAAMKKATPRWRAFSSSRDAFDAFAIRRLIFSGNAASPKCAITAKPRAKIFSEFGRRFPPENISLLRELDAVDLMNFAAARLESPPPALQLLRVMPFRQRQTSRRWLYESAFIIVEPPRRCGRYHISLNLFALSPIILPRHS